MTGKMVPVEHINWAWIWKLQIMKLSGYMRTCLVGSLKTILQLIKHFNTYVRKYQNCWLP